MMIGWENRSGGPAQMSGLERWWGSIRPIEHDFSGVTRHHHFKALGEVGVVETVGNDRSDVESRTDHAAHFVPSFEHFPTVDSFEHQALEDHLVPIDGDF